MVLSSPAAPGSLASSTEDATQRPKPSSSSQDTEQQQPASLLSGGPSSGFRSVGASIRQQRSFDSGAPTGVRWNSSEALNQQVQELILSDLQKSKAAGFGEESWIEETVDEAEYLAANKEEWIEETIEDGEDDEEEDDDEEDELEEQEAPERGIYRKLSGDLLGHTMLLVEQQSTADFSCITTHDWGDEDTKTDDELGGGRLSRLDLHNFVLHSDWKGLSDALTELEEENNPKLFKRAVLKRNRRQETALHTICCKAPTPLALQLLLALHDLHLAHSLLTTTFDAQENTVMHMVCAHTTSTERKQQQLQKSSGSKKSRSSSKHKKSRKSKSHRDNGLKAISEAEELTETTFDSSDCSPEQEVVVEETPAPPAVLDFTILKNLVLLAPEVLEMTNLFGDTPLHLLVTSPGFRSSKYRKSSGETTLSAEMAAEEAIVSLLDVVPQEIAAQPNHQGLTLLHCAIAEGAHERVLVQLLRRLPQAARTPDARGMYALHYAAVTAGQNTKNKASDSSSSSCSNNGLLPWTFGQDLIEEYPPALVEKEYGRGNTPLHLLLSKVQSKKKSHNKKQSKHHRKTKGSKKTKTQEFVLLRNTTKWTALLAQPTATPPSTKSKGGETTSALLIPNQDHMTPLHCCANHSDTTPETMAKLMLDSTSRRKGLAEKACLVQTSNFGSTPLHLACAQEPACVDTMEAILSASSPSSPKSSSNDVCCAIQDCRGRTPLAVAILNPDVSTSVVKILLNASSRATEIPCHGNYLPLHLAMQAQVKESIYRQLVKASPKKSLEATTVHGDTPLHVACGQEGISKHVVKLLLEHYPEAIFLRNNSGKSPYDLARTFNRSLIKSLPQLEVAVPIPDMIDLPSDTAAAVSNHNNHSSSSSSSHSKNNNSTHKRRRPSMSNGGILKNA